MVDAAPPADAVLPDLADQLARPRARRAQRGASTAACCARRSRAPTSTGPTRRCCARSRSRAASRRSCASAGWPRSPTRSGSRSRRRIARSPTPRPARACSARCSRGCARMPRPSRDALAALSPPRRSAAPAGGPHARRRDDQAPQARHVRAARRARRLHLPQRRGAGALRRQVRRAAHPRALALRDVGAGRGLDRPCGDRRPPPDGLGARRARARAPADPRAAPAGQQGPQARRPVRLPALPPGHRLSRCSRSRASPRRGAR